MSGDFEFVLEPELPTHIEGARCVERDCDGSIEFVVDERCYCHLKPPCHYCEEMTLSCNSCGQRYCPDFHDDCIVNAVLAAECADPTINDPFPVRAFTPWVERDMTNQEFKTFTM